VARNGKRTAIKARLVNQSSLMSGKVCGGVQGCAVDFPYGSH